MLNKICKAIIGIGFLISGILLGSETNFFDNISNFGNYYYHPDAATIILFVATLTLMATGVSLSISSLKSERVENEKEDEKDKNDD